MTAVPLWEHVGAIGSLLTIQVLSTSQLLKRNKDLRNALVAKEILLDRPIHDTAAICPGGTMVVHTNMFVKRIRIWSRYEARLKLEFEEA